MEENHDWHGVLKMFGSRADDSRSIRANRTFRLRKSGGGRGRADGVRLKERNLNFIVTFGIFNVVQ